MVDHAHEEKWIVDIKNRLDEQFLDRTKLQPALAVLDTSKDKPSIYWTGSHPERFPIGILLLKSSGNIRDNMWEYVAFMTRWLGLDVTLFLKSMKEREDLVKNYYHYGGEDYQRYFAFRDSYYLQESLLVASCFLAVAILLLQKVRNGAEILRGSRGNNSDERSLQFSILYQRIMKDQIKTKIDMLRIRNQIPWFVVEAVFTNSSLSKLFGTRIDGLAMSCFDDLYPRVNKSKVTGGNLPSGGFKHLLHIFHWTRTPEEGKWPVQQEQPAKRFAEFYIPNATNLLESATSFKRLDSSSNDVVYSIKRISALMQVTPLHLFPYSNEIFRHLLNFEQRYPAYGLPVTAHFACLKSLLQTKEDVKLLQKNGIVQNTMKGEDVLSFLHDIGNFLVGEVRASIPDDLHSLSVKVVEHHERDVSIAYSEFKSQFCPNRWVIISVIAAFTLFVLTFIQTIYSALAYYKGT
ncbi:hypothetical protein LUZ61_020704 [Rhynchospora tenuis]|uniref:Uncharacterized protein n=1 Tax=Rhynchospora tenuis TaxID=198213 RepID=A0AAD5ZDI5_9POAL|nr:hypothetical protein LUZ61_020704 [Rhynchospora tenuis]